MSGYRRPDVSDSAYFTHLANFYVSKSYKEGRLTMNKEELVEYFDAKSTNDKAKASKIVAQQHRLVKNVAFRYIDFWTVYGQWKPEELKDRFAAMDWIDQIIYQGVMEFYQSDVPFMLCGELSEFLKHTDGGEAEG